MNVTIVDYNSGNISSVINSFTEVAKGTVNLEVTSDLNKIKSSDKVVLPGQGSFKSCIDALNSINGLTDTLNEFVINKKKPLFGICVGLQMFADVGYEETETKGLGWISRYPPQTFCLGFFITNISKHLQAHAYSKKWFFFIYHKLI